VGAGLVYAAVQNSNGDFVLPLPAGATAAAAADASILQTNPEYTIVDAPGAASYPLSTFTYAFVWANQNLGTSGGGTWTQGTAYDAVQFLYYIVTQGQSNAATLLYAPLPPSAVSLDLGLIALINYGGASFIPSTTSTASCKFSTMVVGKADKCNVVLTGGSKPTGQYLWSSSTTGTFSKADCKVPASGKCKSSFTGTIASPSTTITSLYTGDLNNAPSISALSLTITQATTKTALSCNKGSVPTALTFVCKAVITGYLPTGTVTFSQTAGTGSVTGLGSCLLTQLGKSTTTAQCSLTLTGGTPGPVTLSASYGGSTNDAASTSTTKTINVT